MPRAGGGASIPSPSQPHCSLSPSLSLSDSHPAAARRGAQQRIPIKLNYSGVRNASPRHLSSFMHLVLRRRQIAWPSIRKGGGAHSKAYRAGERAAWHHCEQPQHVAMLSPVSIGNRLVCAIVQGGPGAARFQGMLFCLLPSALHTPQPWEGSFGHAGARIPRPRVRAPSEPHQGQLCTWGRSGARRERCAVLGGAGSGSTTLSFPKAEQQSAACLLLRPLGRVRRTRQGCFVSASRQNGTSSDFLLAQKCHIN